MIGQDLAAKYLTGNLEIILGNDLVYTPPDKDRYVKQANFGFAKYDDGWKPTGKDAKRTTAATLNSKGYNNGETPCVQNEGQVSWRKHRPWADIQPTSDDWSEGYA
jgi:hypothetical protein